ncbi:PB1 domain-containing protein [Artemisia annua]|uniref:PB1 domain-containing protein n=1 Tax=Artemisia annua TaxID=35608 RepID=A0A2U1LVC3_ARTAN|nr:PB1 domain-containing protein [Artemisia annua]
MEPNFDFQGNSGFLQFWECCASGDSNKDGCYFLLTDQFVSDVYDSRLEAYRRTCLNDDYRFVELEKNVGDWFAGRAAQTQVADYQYDGEALGGEFNIHVFGEDYKSRVQSTIGQIYFALYSQTSRLAGTSDYEVYRIGEQSILYCV